jgi:hypothetical protein
MVSSPYARDHGFVIAIEQLLHVAPAYRFTLSVVIALMLLHLYMSVAGCFDVGSIEVGFWLGG